MTTENKSAITEAIAKASEQLIEALKQGKSEALTQYLEVMARFRSYSFHNVLLIATQRLVTYCYTSLLVIAPLMIPAGLTVAGPSPAKEAVTYG
jgi:hypothetical protein